MLKISNQVFTGEVYLGCTPLRAREPVKISAMWQAYSTVFASLAIDRGDASGKFRLLACPQIGSEHYAIMLYPCDQTAEDDVIPFLVLQLRDRYTLITLSEEALQKVAGHLAKVITDESFTPPGAFEPVFGEITKL